MFKDEYKFLLGILNSELLRWLYKNLTQETNRIFAQVKPINIRKLPVPDFKSTELKQKIVQFVDIMQEIKKKNNKIKEKKMIENQTIKIKKEIDNLVYELYGITEEERKIIEGEMDNDSLCVNLNSWEYYL